MGSFKTTWAKIKNYLFPLLSGNAGVDKKKLTEAAGKNLFLQIFVFDH